MSNSHGGNAIDEITNEQTREITPLEPSHNLQKVQPENLPKSEKPTKRLVKYGADKLSNTELLAILVSKEDNSKMTQTATKLLNTFDGHLKDLFSASIEELLQVEGIEFLKACQIKAGFELAKRTASFCEEDHPFINSTDDVVTLVGPHMMYLHQEEFKVLLLDSRNRLIRYHTVSIGSLDTTLVHPRDVFRPAIAASAASIILVHNHPSGDPTPSEQDILLTRELCMCSKVVCIDILDHIIIGFADYASMKLRELM